MQRNVERYLIRTKIQDKSASDFDEEVEEGADESNLELEE